MSADLRLVEEHDAEVAFWSRLADEVARAEDRVLAALRSHAGWVDEDALALAAGDLVECLPAVLIMRTAEAAVCRSFPDLYEAESRVVRRADGSSAAEYRLLRGSDRLSLLTGPARHGPGSVARAAEGGVA